MSIVVAKEDVAARHGLKNVLPQKEREREREISDEVKSIGAPKAIGLLRLLGSYLTPPADRTVGKMVPHRSFHIPLMRPP